MMINKLLKPTTVEEAYQLLIDNPKARIIGGGAFLRLSKDLKIHTAIDLYGLGLDEIEENDDAYVIGAMTTLRNLETHKVLNPLFSKSLENIVGVQLRNIATIGGTIYPKYGFSDLITSLLVLDTELRFVNESMSLEDYLKEENKVARILTHIVIKKDEKRTAFKDLRNSKGDFALLNVAVSKEKDTYKLAVGAKPSRAQLAYKSMALLNQNGLNEEMILKASKIAAEEMTFGSNRLASESYRKDMCKVLIRRALEEVSKC